MFCIHSLYDTCTVTVFSAPYYVVAGPDIQLMSYPQTLAQKLLPTIILVGVEIWYKIHCPTCFHCPILP